MYTCKSMLAITVKKEIKNLESGERYMGMFGGKGEML